MSFQRDDPTAKPAVKSLIFAVKGGRKVRKLYRHCCILLVMLILMAFVTHHFRQPGLVQAAKSQNLSETRILVITSQPYATEWFNSFNEKFVEELNKARPVQAKISYEYIDGKIASDAEKAATVVAFMKQKYDWRNMDLIIGVMSAGSAFLLEHGDQFAQGIPQLYVLPSPRQLPKIAAQPSMGVIQSTGDAITGTIKNIREVLPEAKHLYVVAGVGPDDKEYFTRTQRLLMKEKYFKNVVFLAGLDTDELINELSTAPKDSAVLLLTYVMNNYGQPVTTNQVLRAVAPQIHAPIFSFYDTVFGQGIVGGNLTSSAAYGEAAADAAHRLLNGEQKYFAVTVSPRFMYDWRQLKRWKIDENRLPSNSQIQYIQYSFWDLYKWYMIGTFLLLLLQGFFIAMLLVNRVRLRKLGQALQKSNDVLEDKVSERTAELTAANEELIASNEELTALNEEITAMNETLDSLNSRMAKEIEERLRMEAELASTNVKLKELDRMKSMFIASMSHELRTPLNSIIGFTGMTLQELSGPLNEEQKDNLGRVKKAANHLLSLITDVIDISKIESGRVESILQPFLLNGLITEAIDTLRTQIKEKGLLIEVETGKDIAMCTDRRRLLQCLINFLSNAVKYSESGKITVGVRQTDAEVELSVTDTGIGIAAADLPKLFEPFERVQSHLQVKAGGTGLGLYLTKKLATEILHGEVSVESIQGMGSTFRIRVPKTLSKEVNLSENGVGH